MFSLVKRGYVFGNVGLSVCLYVSVQHYSTSYEWIAMKFYGRVLGGTIKNRLHFAGHLGLLR